MIKIFPVYKNVLKATEKKENVFSTENIANSIPPWILLNKETKDEMTRKSEWKKVNRHVNYIKSNNLRYSFTIAARQTALLARFLYFIHQNRCPREVYRCRVI